MNIFLLLLLFAVIIAVVAPELVRRKSYREIWAFAGVTLIAMVLSFGQALHLPIPNITKGIEALVRPVYFAFERLLLP
ncbi:MAG: hypothetical protein IBX71_09450 [Candidatus Desulforudis sp.]|nr:hypothetical protein [Desulforudis sp.]